MCLCHTASAVARNNLSIWIGEKNGKLKEYGGGQGEKELDVCFFIYLMFILPFFFIETKTKSKSTLAN